MSKLFYNANIITVDEKQPKAQALFVKEGKIVAVGSNDEIKALKESDSEMIDLKGKTMIPSFVDGHSHFSMVCSTSLFGSISVPPVGTVTCIDDIIQVLKKSAESNNNEILVGWGYDHEELKEHRHPTRHDLDKVSTERAVVAVHASAHLGVANTKALEQWGINSDSVDPEGGFIGREDDGKTPSGYLEETAWMPFMIKSFPPATPEVMTEMLKKGSLEYAKNGITTVHDGIPGDNEYALYQFAIAQKLLIQDLHCYPGLLMKNSWREKMKIGEKQGRMKFSGLKIFLDGSPQGRTAWMTQPYLPRKEGDDPQYRAYPIYEDDEVVIKAIEECFKNNTTLLTHVNGDAAADQLLRCYEEAKKRTPPTKELRSVAIHSQTARPDQLDKMKELGIYPSFFSSHIFFWGDTHRKNFGEERASMISNTAHAQKIGLSFSDHNDSPVLPPKPLFSMWTAVNRKTRSGYTLGKEQAITPFEALKSQTIYAAFQHFDEEVKGSICVGKFADLAILDRDPLEVDPMEIKDIQVLETLKEGKTIFKHQ